MFYLLPLLVLGQAIGILAADLAWIGLEVARGLLVVSALVIPPLCRGPRSRAASAILLALAAGATNPGARLDRGTWSLPLEFSGDRIVEAEICGLQSASGSRLIEVCRVRDLGSRPVPDFSERLLNFPNRLLLQPPMGDPYAGAMASLALGDRIRARARPSAHGGYRNPGRPDSDLRWRRRGIAGKLRLSDPVLLIRIAAGTLNTPRLLGGASAWVEGLRSEISTRLRFSRGLAPPEAPGGVLLAALAVGDRSGLASSDREAFSRVGVAHVLAISGLHLALVAGIGFVILRWLFGCCIGDRGRDLRIPALLGACVLAAIYACFSGFGVSVQRALLFAWALLLGLASRRRIPTAHLLAAAGGLILVRSPYALFELGTQLSFAATAGLLLSSSVDTQSMDPADLGQRFVGRAKNLVQRSAVAVAVTAPVLAWHGLPSSPVGVASNLVMIPWLGFVLLPAALLGSALGLMSSAPTEYLLQLARMLGEFTLRAVHSWAEYLPQSRISGRPAAWALLLAMVPALGVMRSRTPIGSLAALTLVVLWLRWAPVAQVEPKAPRLVAFDVGQGDSILLQGDRATILVDGGRAIPGLVDLGRSVVARGIAELGIVELTVVVATHGDIDHRGGLDFILNNFRVLELWLPWGAASDSAFRDLVELALRRGVEIREVGVGSAPRLVGEFGITFLWPPVHDLGASSNDRSLVLRAEAAGSRILFTGDIGFEVENRLLAAGVDLSSDILKVAHHGSGGSSGPGFLRASNPSLALVSASCRSNSRLPHPRTLRRFEASEIELAWTGRDGAILIGLDSPGGKSGPRIMRKWGSPRICSAVAGKRTAGRVGGNTSSIPKMDPQHGDP